MPSSEELARSGVLSFSAGDSSSSSLSSSSSSLSGSSGIEKLTSLLSKLPDQSTSTNNTEGPLVQVGEGFHAIPKKIADKIKANEFIDFSELRTTSQRQDQTHLANL